MPVKLAAKMPTADRRLLEKPEEISVAWREYFESSLNGGIGKEKRKDTVKEVVEVVDELDRDRNCI